MACKSLPHVTLIEVRNETGELVTEQGAQLYQALGSSYRGTYEQMQLVYGSTAIKWVGVLAAAEHDESLLFRDAVTGTWNDVTTASGSCEPRSLAGDVTYILNTINALIYRLEEEHPDFILIGHASQAYHWLEQVLHQLDPSCGAVVMYHESSSRK